LAHPLPQNIFIAHENISGSASYWELLKRAAEPLSTETFKALSEKAEVIDIRSDLKDSGLIAGSYWLAAKGALAYWLSILIPHEADIIVVCDPS
jgi:hypothetical protein